MAKAKVRELESISKDELTFLIEQNVVGRNAERNRAILYRKLVDGIKFEKVAEEFEMSDRQIKNIVYRYFDRILLDYWEKKDVK